MSKRSKRKKMNCEIRSVGVSYASMNTFWEFCLNRVYPKEKINPMKSFFGEREKKQQILENKQKNVYKKQE